jgi:Holliday junction resolvase RusA-like endonuclease
VLFSEGFSLPPRTATMTLPVPPSANDWWRNVLIWTGKGGLVAQAKAFLAKLGVRVEARTLISKEAREYKASVASAFSGRVPMTGDVCVTIRWYREARRGDLDKRQGVLLDALQGVAYVNDGQVAQLHAYRYEDKANPRVIVTVEAL